MSIIFYKLFSLVWKKKYDWIDHDKLIDTQIVRINASLRMVGSSKLKGGYVLEMDDDKYTLEDSLIRIYSKTMRKQEQIITEKNINSKKCMIDIFKDKGFDYTQLNSQSLDKNYDPDMMHSTDAYEQLRAETKVKNILGEYQITDSQYGQDVYDACFKLCDKIKPGIFKKGKIKGIKMNLMREKPKKCLLSGKFHENENAFLSIYKRETHYEIRYGCYRYCHDDIDTVIIGGLNIKTLKPIEGLKFDPEKSFKSKKKAQRTKKEIINDKKYKIKEMLDTYELLNLYTNKKITLLYDDDNDDVSSSVSISEESSNSSCSDTASSY
jgi:hypothetical protein